MRMVRVEHFRSTMHDPPLDRIAQVGARNRRRRIAERVGAVCQRLILKSEILMLQVHLVDPKWLATIIQGTAARTIGIGERIALREKSPFLFSGRNASSPIS